MQSDLFHDNCPGTHFHGRGQRDRERKKTEDLRERNSKFKAQVLQMNDELRESRQTLRHVTGTFRILALV